MRRQSCWLLEFTITCELIHVKQDKRHDPFPPHNFWTLKILDSVKDMADIFRVVWSLHTLTLVPPFLYAFGIIIFHEQFHLTYFTYTMGYILVHSWPFCTVNYKPLNARASGEDGKAVPCIFKASVPSQFFFEAP